APNTKVEKKKKPNANQVRRNFKRPTKLTLLTVFSGLSCVPSRASDKSARLHQSVETEVQPINAATKPAVLHPAAAAVVAMIVGPAAQPRLPARPCAENACPNRSCDTR